MTDEQPEPKQVGELSRRRRSLWPIIIVSVAAAVGGHKVATYNPQLTEEHVRAVQKIVRSDEFQDRYGDFLPEVIGHEENVILLIPKGEYLIRADFERNAPRRRTPSSSIDVPIIPGVITKVEIPKGYVLTKYENVPDDFYVESLHLEPGTVLLGPPRSGIRALPYELDTPEKVKRSVEEDLRVWFVDCGLPIVLKGVRSTHTTGTVIEPREFSLWQRWTRPKLQEREPDEIRHDRQFVYDIPPPGGKGTVDRRITRQTRRMRC